MLPLLTALALAFSSSPEPSSAFLTRPTDGTYDDMASVPREKLNKCSNPDAIPVKRAPTFIPAIGCRCPTLPPAIAAKPPLLAK
jgi:hypothetical protein